MVGAVKIWRQGVAGMVVTALVFMPGLATTCAVSCLRATAAPASSAAGSAAHAHRGSTAHAHHGSNPAQSETRVRAEPGAAPGHDCRDHDGVIHRWGTVSQSAGADRQVVSASEQPLQFPLAVSASIARHIRSTHGPPGTSGVVTPLVLRI